MLEFFLVLLIMVVLGYIIMRFFPFIGWLFFGIGFAAIIFFIIAGLFILSIPVILAILLIVVISKLFKGLSKS